MSRVLPALLFIASVAFAASPLFVTSFAGFNPDQFPVPQVDPAIQPAGYAFSIWGLIYAWLIVGTGFGLLRRADATDWQAHRLPLLASLSIGVFWLATAEWSPLAATVAIWVMLAGALLALSRSTMADRWLQKAPIAIYAGWLTAASSVSVGLILGGSGIMPEVPAALVALAVALGLSLMVQAKMSRTPEYGLTVIWALIAVVVANATPSNPVVLGAALLGVFALAISVWRASRP